MIILIIQALNLAASPPAEPIRTVQDLQDNAAHSYDQETPSPHPRNAPLFTSHRQPRRDPSNSWEIPQKRYHLGSSIQTASVGDCVQCVGLALKEGFICPADPRHPLPDETKTTPTPIRPYLSRCLSLALCPASPPSTPSRYVQRRR